ncbi:hydratase [Sandaracinobacteroides saxicola]|nr:hydratase [Sandaracinobacteroides saxicola]
MTERRAAALERSPAHLAIGPSHLHWTGDHLTIALDEICAPLPQRIRGTIRVYPHALVTQSFALDAEGRHVWQPVATAARIEVELTSPALRWHGTAYFDSNFGATPLEDGFTHWDWSRAHLAHDTVVFYEGQRRDGSDFALALAFDAAGAARAVEAPPLAPLPRSAWRIPRTTRADAGQFATVNRTWTDSPFYARTQLTTHLFGEPVSAIHESLSLTRFRSPLVRAMLPFRMPRTLR